MSIRVMNGVWVNSQRAGSELLVLLALADHADDNGVCYPSVAALAAKSRLSERQVRYVLRQLEEAGELETEVGAGPHGCNRYRIVPPAHIAPRQTVPPEQTAAPLQDVPLHELPPANHAPGNAAPEGGNPAYVGGQPIAPEPSKNHQENRQADHPRERGSLDDDPEMAIASRALSKARIAINSYVADDLADFLDRGTKGEWVAAACAIAASNGAKSWNYVKRVLEGWGPDGPPQREETTNGNGTGDRGRPVSRGPGRGPGRNSAAGQPDPDNPIRRRLELDRANEAAELAALERQFAPTE